MLAIQEIEKLNLDTLLPLTVVTGEDIGQFELLKDKILSNIGFDKTDLNFIIYDIGRSDFNEILLDLESLPFFSDEKVVILDYFVDLTTSKKRSLTDEALNKFEAYLEQPSPSTKLIILAHGKLDGKRRIVKRLKRDGQIFETKELKHNELSQYFTGYVKTINLDLAPSLLEQVFVKSSFDFGQIQKNLIFLKAYKPNQTINSEDIEKALPKTLQDNLFDLTQLILQKKVDTARELVQDLILKGEDEIKLIAVMIGQFRLLTQVKILSQEGHGESQIINILNDLLGRKVNPYQIKFALRDSQKLSLPLIKKVQKVLIETDYKIKIGLYEKAYLFDLALLKIAQG